jgi:hypothetical protein
MEGNPPPPPLVLEEVFEPAEEDTDGSMEKFEGWAALPCVTLVLPLQRRQARLRRARRALDAEEPLQPGQLYFVLQASALRRIRTSAALGVKASRAPAVDASLPPSRRKGGRCDGEAGRLTNKPARVAPLVALSSSSKESQISVPGNTASKA